MKKFAFLLAFLAVVGLSLKAQAYEPWGFGIYNGTLEPMDYSVPGATLGSKTGEATCKTVLGIVNWGDCSLRSAMKNGRISRVTSADWKKNYVLIYGEKTLRVYGN